MRVYEIAREVGIPNKDLLAKIRALGLEVNNHMSSLDADDVARIKRSLEKEKQVVAEPQQTQRLSSTVLRRHSTGKKDDEDAPAPEPRPTPSAPPRAAAAAAPARPVVAERAPSPVPVIRRRVVTDEPVATAPVSRSGAGHAVQATQAEPEPRADEHHDGPHAEPSTNHGHHAPATPEAAEAPAAVEARHQPAPERTERTERHDRVESRPVVEAAPAERSERHDRHERAPHREAPAPSERIERPAPVIERAASASPPISHSATINASGHQIPVETVRRSRVILAGPQMVGAAGSGPTQAVGASGPAVAPSPPPSSILPPRVINPPPRMREPTAPIPTGPRTVEEMADSARSRFEMELERARARTTDRPAPVPGQRGDGEVAVEAAEPAPRPTPPVRDPSRPAVGTVISLPPRIKITERTPVMGRPMPGGAGPGGPGPGGAPANAIRGRFAQQQQTRGRPGADFGRKKLPLGKKGKQTQLTTPAEHKRIIRIEDTISVSELARGMGIKATEVLKKLWGMGMTGVNINASIDFDTAQILSGEFGYEVQNVAFKEEDIFSEKAEEAGTRVHRAPVVTVMGHVDHGKTSLLDAIRRTRVAAGESGGITQHVAAYKVKAPGHGDIVFLDTPGHEAFTEMRARGAQATDIVVLVVAANDGVMPQTLEALAHAKDAKVTIIVAVNKIDMPDAAPDRVRQQLADHGLIPEEWGGDTIYVNVSALRGENIDKLLASIAVSAEVLELRANPDKSASGIVIEARLDRNRGPMATVLVQEGTLRVGDILVAGRTFGKVRAMLDDRGETIKEAGPSTPIEVLGLDGVPEAGDQANVAEDDKVAKQVVEHRRQGFRRRELASTGKMSLENLMERLSESAVKELKIVLKADVQGSAEALKAALIKLSTEKVKVNVIAAAVGGITESDVQLARAGGAIIVGFHVRPAGKSAKLAEQEDVEIRLYDIIYDALDEVRTAMAGLLAPIKREVAMGKLQVRDTFSIPKIGMVAGCMVTDGKVNRKALLRIIRDAVQVYEGRVGSLRRFKDDVSEVQNGYECGVMVAGYNDLKTGDVIEAYEVIEEAAKL